MTNDKLLAALLAQAEDGPWRSIIEEASELGARRALACLGLEDERAGRDMRELRDLVAAWREAKKSAVKAVAGWLVRIVLALIVVGIAVKTGIWERLG
jgi:hypothetical protein